MKTATILACTMVVMMLTALISAAAAETQPPSSPSSKPTSDAARAELKNLQGTWRIVRAESKGVDVRERLGYDQFTVEGNTMRMVRNGEERKSQFELDPAHDPKWINITTPRGDRIEGIYELKGDSWRTASSKVRPATLEDKTAIVLVYERVKDAATTKSASGADAGAGTGGGASGPGSTGAGK